MSFLQFKVKTRIFGGFGILVAFGLGLALFACWQLTEIKGAVGTMSNFADNSTRTLEISRQFEVMRRTSLRYKIDGDAASLKEGTEAAANAVELLQTAAKITLSDARRKTYNGLEADVGSLVKKRESLIDATKKLLGDRQTLFAAGDELSAASEKVVKAARVNTDSALGALASNVEASVLLVRVANWRFQATQDPKGPAAFKSNIELANGAIAALEKSAIPEDARSFIGPLKTALARYGTAFESYAANALRSDEVYDKEMRPQTIAMLESVNTAAASLKADFERTKSSTDATVGSTITMQEIIAGLALVLGSALAYFIGGSIVRPLVGMTAAMGKLAAGNFETDVPGLERKDEIGEIARAVDVLKVAGAEQARLEAEKSTIELRAEKFSRTTRALGLRSITARPMSWWPMSTTTSCT